ncbi:GNAT family N-acetyltransferase [Anaeromicropila herbilytica]|uniref:hypothetical protein n=1 Tax=Anaeromicropila herbilytica TaxID=2785025 RepID=UPI0038CBFC47
MKLGYHEVYLWTFEKNSNARVFYEKLGYIYDGTENIIEPLNAKEIRYIKKL